MVSDTPRTDEFCKQWTWDRNSDIAKFAAKLEREVMEKTATDDGRTHYADPDTLERMAQMEREIERLRAILKDEIEDGCDCRQCARRRAALGEER